MDRPVTAAVGGVMSEPGVEGVLVASMPSGMAVASAGIAPPHAAGFIASLASRAHSLDPKGARPTVVIDTANDIKVLIRSNDKVAMAVYTQASELREPR